MTAPAAYASESWSPSTRHDLALAVAGFLARRLEEPDVVAIVRAAALVTEDDEVAGRERAVSTTVCRLEAGERAVGLPTTGRPCSYCSTGCRRTAEFEIRRLVRRIERLETSLESLRGVRDDGIPDVYGHSPKKRRSLMAEGIKEAEARLRALLESGEIGTEETELARA